SSEGALGAEGVTDSTVPVAVKVPENTKFTKVSAGYDHVLAVTTDGKVYAWGSNGQGQLGIDSVSSANVPTLVSALETVKIVSVAAGKQYSLALSESGVVYAWGLNSKLQLGISGSNISVPTVIETLTSASVFVTQIFAGETSAAALTGSGALWLWGNNDQTQLGTDGSTCLPYEVTKITTAVISVALGAESTTLFLADGSVCSMGLNSVGQFGNGETADSKTMNLKSATLDESVYVSEIAAGSKFIAILSGDGALYVCGSAVGSDDSATLNTTPTSLSVGADLTVASVSAGYLNGAAILQDGTVWTWGDNGSGQLSNGTKNNSATPVQVVGVGGEGVLRLGSAPYVQSVALYVRASVPSPTYTISIPSQIDLGELHQTNTESYSTKDFNIGVSDVANLYGEYKIVVSIQSDSGFVLTDGDGNTLSYGVYKNETGGTALESGAVFAEFEDAGSVTGWLRTDQSRIVKSGNYSGTLHFVFNVEPISE
ncbi:MAG: hypothetical protein IJW92_06845, partial [Clostridia bacterium]|nr:hypothetical protein [Clostridia bacterium]